MAPTKSRERKCSTCRHYQPSPLWRKGWCRNPLLYDRNTNHLVEADSLSCNRTFIDYWEPIEGPVPAVGPQPKSTKPRIAPSIPVSTVDAKGRRNTVTGNTPAGGMAAVASDRRPSLRSGRGRPALALVPSDLDPDEAEAQDPSKVTQRIEEIEGPESSEIDRAPNTAERIRSARSKGRTAFPLSGRNLYVAIGLLIALLLLGGTYGIMNRNAQNVPAVVPTMTATLVQPTPTGLGDPTPTVEVPPTTPPAPPTDVIAVNGWVQVAGTGQGLVVRREPGRAAARVTVLRDGSTARVVEGPQEVGGITWWKLDNFNASDPGLSGWSAGQFLAPIPPPAP